MKILFVRSGNRGIDPISTNQGDSLLLIGIDVEYFDILGKGLIGYLSNVVKLKRVIKKIKPDLIHAHYSLCGLVSVLSLTNKPIITSLMGSDVKANKCFRWVIYYTNLFFWEKCIVKSQEMKDSIGIKQAMIIPNGVDIKKYYPNAKIAAKEKLKWVYPEKIILFAADHNREEKNFKLAQAASKQMNIPHVLISLGDIKQSDMVYYYNAADVVLLTSLWEGSPNVIKEAMACNCPIVTTDVGDVSWILGNTEGSFICSYDPEDVAKNIQKAIEFADRSDRTNGRKRIIEIGLDSESIAKKIANVYELVLNP